MNSVDNRINHQQLWVSIWFNSLLTDRELNKSATFVLLSYHISDMLTDHIMGILENRTNQAEEELSILNLDKSAYCAGSGISFPSSTQSALCYCGRTFHRRFNTIQKTWTIRKHQP